MARNILARSLRELLVYPLAFDQVAPFGFLAVEKLVTMLFGSSERAFWLFPLVVGIFSLFLFLRLAQQTVEGIAIPIAVFLFAISVSMIRYSAEMKQYGLDAAAAIALTLVAIDLWRHDRSARALLLAGVAGFAIIWFSHASVLVMAGLGGAFAIAAVTERDRRAWRALAITVPIWAAASVAGLVMAERSMTPSTKAFMSTFWQGGFLPLPVRPVSAATWLWQRLVSVYADPWTLRYPFAWAVAIVALVGVVALWRRDRVVAMFVIAPFAMTLLAAVAQRYPFRQRLIVFLVPSALIVFAAGIGCVFDIAARRSRFAAAALAALALVPPILAIVDSRLPTRVDDYTPLYEKLRAERRPGDAIHVSFLGHSSVIFYGPRYGVLPADVQRGACERKDARVYLRDLDRYRGRDRVWILARPGPAYLVAEENMRRYLGAIAVRREFLSVRSGVTLPMTLSLYDLSDPARLAAASAETFPVTPLPDYPKPGCRDWSGEAAVNVTKAEH